MARLGGHGRGMAGQGRAWQGGRGAARHGLARRGLAVTVKAGRGQARRGLAVKAKPTREGRFRAAFSFAAKITNTKARAGVVRWRHEWN